MEGYPKIRAGGKYFQARSHRWIGVTDRLESLAVQLTRRGLGGGAWGYSSLRKYRAGFFRVQRRVVKDGAHLRLFAALGQNSQLLLRTVVLSGEAEEFKQKVRCPMSVG